MVWYGILKMSGMTFTGLVFFSNPFFYAKITNMCVFLLQKKITDPPTHYGRGVHLNGRERAVLVAPMEQALY